MAIASLPCHVKQSDCLPKSGYIWHLTAVFGVCSNRPRVIENKRLSKCETDRFSLIRRSVGREIMLRSCCTFAKTNVNRWHLAIWRR